MERKQPLPLLAIIVIGVLVAGILVCVIVALVAGGLVYVKSPLSPWASPTSTVRLTRTPTPISPAGRPTHSITQTPSSLAESLTPLASSTPSPSNVTPSPTFAPTATPMPTNTPEPPAATSTNTPEPVIATSTNTPEPTDTPTPSATSPTHTSTPIPPPTSTGTPTPTPYIVTPRPRTATPTPLPPTRLTGRVVKDGVAVQGVNVRLEDQSYVTIATVATDAQGTYTFDNLTVFDTELNVLFTQEWNEQYDVSEVVSWAWLGPLTISRGDTVEMPDFEIGLLGFEQVNPPTGASYPAGDISAQNPLTFEWTPYPAASAYWVDLTQGDDPTIVWQSSLVDTTSVTFDGTSNDGSHITADNYWWGIGARKDVGDYQLTVYGYLLALIMTP